MSGSPRYQNTIKQLFKLALPEACGNVSAITVHTIKQSYPKFRSSVRSDWYDLALDCIGILRPDGGYGNLSTMSIESTQQLIEEVLVSNSQSELIPELALAQETQKLDDTHFEDIDNEDDEDDEEFTKETFLRDAAKKRKMLDHADGFEKLLEDTKRTDYVNNSHDLLKIVGVYSADCRLIEGFPVFVRSDEQRGQFAGFKLGRSRTPNLRDFYSNLVNIYFDEYREWYDNEDSLNDSKIYDTTIKFWFEIEDVRLNFEFVCCEGNLYLTNESGEKDLVSKFLENWFTKDVFYYWLRESEHPVAESIRLAKKVRLQTEKSAANFAKKITRRSA